MSNSTATNTENIQDIQSLQKTEKELLDNLETNTHLTPDIRQQLIDKINAITNMRINLYKTLKETTGLYQTNLEQSQNTLIQQTAAIDIEEKNLNDIKRRLKLLQERNLQELRVIEINQYYSDKYSDHSKIALAFIMLFIGLIIIHILYNGDILPKPVYWTLVIILTGYIAYKFWNTLFLMYRRNNMNYDQIDFSSPKISSTATATATTTTSSSSSNTSIIYCR